MAYEPTKWNNDDVITAEKLNKLEQGVKNEQLGRSSSRSGQQQAQQGQKAKKAIRSSRQKGDNGDPGAQGPAGQLHSSSGE